MLMTVTSTSPSLLERKAADTWLSMTLPQRSTAMAFRMSLEEQFAFEGTWQTAQSVVRQIDSSAVSGALSVAALESFCRGKDNICQIGFKMVEKE